MTLYGGLIMDYKFCPNCGQKLKITDQFCSNCGTKQPEVSQNNNVNNQVLNNEEKTDGEGSNDYYKENQTLYDINNEKSDVSESFNGHLDNQVNLQEQNQSKQTDFVRKTSPNYYMAHSSSIDHNQQFSQQNQRRSENEQYYNESKNPGFLNSFNIFCSSFGNINKCMGRADFWWGYLGMTLISYLVMICCWLLFLLMNPGEDVSYTFGVIYLVFSIIIGLITFTAIVDRLHDTGHSGWNYCWIFTGIGGIYLLYLLCLPTNQNEKRWVRINE